MRPFVGVIFLGVTFYSVLLRKISSLKFCCVITTCAYALLGEKARALSFLERELNSNHPTEGARERQRAWARDDPDLASLRAEPRFQLLTAE